MFLLGDRQFPGALNGNPVGGVLAPVGSVLPVSIDPALVLPWNGSRWP